MKQNFGVGSHTHLSRQSVLEVRHVVSAEKRREINCWNNGAEGRFFIIADNLIKLGWFMQRKSIVQTGTNAEKAFDPCYAEGHVR